MLAQMDTGNTTPPEVFGGRPCIRGLGFPVSRLLGLLAAGETPEAILESSPYLEREDIHEALGYAALLADAHQRSTRNARSVFHRPGWPAGSI